ncbi:MAG TPA: RcnB family protein [Sphingomonas sp.]
MRKGILASLLVASLLPAAAMAQPYGEARHDRRDWHEGRDARGDWRDYRRAHPEVYRGSAYVGPRAGWRYRPVAAGYRFDPAFYGQRYWIDPVRYRLPPVGAYQRWVRYGNDVVLVNVRTGRVIDVNGGFFL